MCYGPRLADILTVLARSTGSGCEDPRFIHMEVEKEFMRRYTIPLALSLALVSAAGAAKAVSLSHVHDGFYLRMELGFGYMHAPASLKVNDVSADLTISGFGAGGGIQLGGTVARGLVVGGATQGFVVSSPKASADGASVTMDGSANMFLVGPFLAYYPDPTNGLNFGGLIGYAGFYGTEDNGETTETDTGLGISAWLGHDWWVSDEWSLGIAGRISWAHVSYSQGGYSETVDVFTPAVLFTATYH